MTLSEQDELKALHEAYEVVQDDLPFYLQNSLTDSKIIQLEEVILYKAKNNPYLDLSINQEHKANGMLFTYQYGQKAEAKAETRPLALANLLVKLKESFADEDREQIKEILEG